MSMLTETLVTTVAFEANLNGLEIARQGLLNLTRDINNVAYRFTNMFEKIANSLLGIAGPGMFGSITIASVLLPHQEAIYDLELATGHWAQSSKDSLADYRDALAQTGRWTEREIAGMQAAFAEAHLEVPRDRTQVAFLSELAEEALRLKDVYKTTGLAAQKMLADAVAAQQQRGANVDVKKIADSMAYARTAMGWKQADVQDFWERRANVNPEDALPVATAMAVGQMGLAGGRSATDTNKMFEGLIAKLKKAQEDRATWAMADMRSQGLSAGSLLGSLTSGNIPQFLDQIRSAKLQVNELYELGDGELFSPEEAVTLDKMLKSGGAFADILRRMNDEASGVAGSLERAHAQSEKTMALSNALTRAHNAMQRAFTIMADAGVLDALIQLMSTIAKVVELFNNMPGPVKFVVALIIRLNIWFAIITSTLTTLIGLMIAFIMYGWGMSSMIRILLFVIGNLGGAVVLLGNGITWLSVQLGILSLRTKAAATTMAGYGAVGTIVSFVLRSLGTTLFWVSKLMGLTGLATTATGKALGFTAVVGKVLTRVYDGLMRALGLYLKFMWIQFKFIAGMTTAVWRYVAARFAEGAVMGIVIRRLYAAGAAAVITALKFAALLIGTVASTIGFTGLAVAMAAANIAGGPILWLVAGIVVAIAALVAGIIWAVKNWDTFTGAIKSGVQWLMGLNKWFLVLLGPIGLVIIALLKMWDIFKKVRDSKFGQWVQKKFLGIDDPKTAEDRADEEEKKQRESKAGNAKSERDKRFADAQAERQQARDLQKAQEEATRRENAARQAKDRWDKTGVQKDLQEWDSRRKDAETARAKLEDLKEGKGVLRTVGEKTGFVMPSMDDTDLTGASLPSGGGFRGGGGNMAPMGTGPIAMARSPGMNLPVGRGAARGGGTTTIHNEFTITVTAEPGTDLERLAQKVGEAVAEKLEGTYRETQANFPVEV